MSDQLKQITQTLWEIPATARADMRVPARVFADDELIKAIIQDRSLEQLENVATLPGVVHAALAMPDIHQGYGFPVGGVAATVTPDGVISPGGVGYDINCGVRLLALPLDRQQLGARTEALVHEISRRIPAGTGREGKLLLSGSALNEVLIDGPRALIKKGIGSERDIEFTESEGRLEWADPSAVSQRARDRGSRQLGTAGSGNHFVEVQYVEKCLDESVAEAFGLAENQITILIHSGSRGLGHQVCTDYVKQMDSELAQHGIELPDRQLACGPLSAPTGQRYFGAMACAANFAWANRHAIAAGVREAIAAVIDRQTAQKTLQIYDVAHNIAKLETYDGQQLCVHRKGATRAFPPGSSDIPQSYRSVGQPVFIPGSMGTASYVLVGQPKAMESSFGTTCHGAGRRLSRTKARHQIGGAQLRHHLNQQGIAVRCPSNRGLAEEAPFAYKDVDRVVQVVEQAQLARRVVRLRPIGVVKG